MLLKDLKGWRKYTDTEDKVGVRCDGPETVGDIYYRHGTDHTYDFVRPNIPPTEDYWRVDALTMQCLMLTYNIRELDDVDHTNGVDQRPG
jgi:hypothetical protein